MLEMAKIISDHFSKYGYDIQTTLTEDPEKINPRMRFLLDKEYSVDNSKSKEILGMKYDYSYEDSLVEMMKAAIKAGVVEDKIS